MGAVAVAVVAGDVPGIYIYVPGTYYLFFFVGGLLWFLKKDLELNFWD